MVNKYLWKIVLANELPQTRQYFEEFTIKFCGLFEQETEEYLFDALKFQMPTQLAPSVISIVGEAFLNKTQSLDKLPVALLPHTLNPSAHIRVLAQYFISRLN